MSHLKRKMHYRRRFSNDQLAAESRVTAAVAARSLWLLGVTFPQFSAMTVAFSCVALSNSSRTYTFSSMSTIYLQRRVWGKRCAENQLENGFQDHAKKIPLRYTECFMRTKYQSLPLSQHREDAEVPQGFLKICGYRLFLIPNLRMLAFLLSFFLDQKRFVDFTDLSKNQSLGLFFF